MKPIALTIISIALVTSIPALAQGTSEYGAAYGGAAVVIPGTGETWVEWPDENTPALIEQRTREQAYSEIAWQYMEAANWYKSRGDHQHMIVNLYAAADHNSADAHYELARLHVEGVYLPLNFESATHHLQAASDLGNAEAKRVYARMLLRGDLGEPEIEKGLALLTEAAESSPRALGELGMFYAGMLDDNPRDIELGVSMIYQAAQMGDLESSQRLSEISGLPASILEAPARLPTAYSIAGHTGEQVFQEAAAIMLRAQQRKSLDDEALAYALYSLAHEHLGHEQSGRELNYIDGVRVRMSESDPNWLIDWQEKARAHLASKRQQD